MSKDLEWIIISVIHKEIRQILVNQNSLLDDKIYTNINWEIWNMAEFQVGKIVGKITRKIYDE